MNITLLAVPVAALLLAGCGSSAPKAAVTKTVTVAPSVKASVQPARATKTPAPPSHSANPGNAPGTLRFGKTYTSANGDGRTFTIGVPTAYTPSSYAAIGTKIPGARYWKVKITVFNGAKQALPMVDIQTQVTSGTTSDVNGVTDVDNNIGGDPSTTLLPGRTVIWWDAYPVVPGQHLTIAAVDVLSDGTPFATWDGVVG